GGGSDGLPGRGDQEAAFRRRRSGQIREQGLEVASRRRRRPLGGRRHGGREHGQQDLGGHRDGKGRRGDGTRAPAAPDIRHSQRKSRATLDGSDKSLIQKKIVRAPLP